MKHPEKLVKVRTEVDTAFANGTLSHPVQYSQAIRLPYLCAVINEAARIFPSFQVSMPRLAPGQGLQFDGKHIPAGCAIGMNPYVVQRDRDVFGEDADEFRPERWLESEEHTRQMEKAIIGFGAGTRQCTGRPVRRNAISHCQRELMKIQLARLMNYKLLPEILRRFEFEMAHDRPWRLQNAAFCVQHDVVCKFKRRELF
jgi:cytochrome P450